MAEAAAQELAHSKSTEVSLLPKSAALNRIALLLFLYTHRERGECGGQPETIWVGAALH